jgi:predicted transcriptional regulator
MIYNKDKGANMKRAINLYLDEEVIEKLEELAKVDDMSKSAYLSEWITADWDAWKTFDQEFNNATTTNDKPG